MRSLTHEHAPNNIRRQPSPKHSNPLLLADTIQPGHGVRIAEALCARLGGIGAHADEDDLPVASGVHGLGLSRGAAHLCRIPNHARQTARDTSAGNGGCGAELGGSRSLLQLLRQNAVQAETGSRVCGLPEDRRGQA